MNAAASLPDYAVLAEALRTTTERLAHEIAAPTETPPDWDTLEWDVARAVSAMQGISVLLAHRLCWRGPDSWRDFLSNQRHLALQRDARIESLLSRLDAALRDSRAGAVALKGSALRRLGLYQPAERPMGDLDLLVDPADEPRVAAALESLDYASLLDVRRHRIFAPRTLPSQVHPGEHPDNPLKIEMHFRVAELLPVRAVDITASLIDEDRRPGLHDYPHVRELFRHLLLHAAGNMRAHALRQVQLHDIALLAGRLSAEDWQALRETPAERGGSWWMWPVLALAKRYYPDAIPATAEAFSTATPRWLRHAARRWTLTDISWSNLRIHALPGLPWSRTAADVFQFASGRIFPSRVALDELRGAVGAQPTLTHQNWYTGSQARRILRWLVSRPRRVQTMLAIENARLISTPAARR